MPLWNIIIVLLIIFTSIYCLQISLFLFGLFKLRKGNNPIKYPVSIIVPARNEEKNIADCLLSLVSQDYPKELYEIIVVDDRSTDKTADIVLSFADKYNNVKLLRVDKSTNVVLPKRHAISVGIENSKNEIIFTTDADCTVPRTWLSEMIKYFEDDVGLVAGVVDYKKTDKTNSIFQGIQHLDFFSHTACSAGGIAIGKANNVSGANLAYRKSVYKEVDGFSKIVHPTGDDSFFSQMISRKTKWKAKFAISKGTNVSTLPMLTLRQFINQRIRWASQGIRYPIETVVFLISTFFMFVIILFTLPATIILKILNYQLPQTWSVPLFCFLIKGLIDFLILLKFALITEKISLLKFFPITEIIHIPYILISALGGYFMKFEWKGFEPTSNRTIE